MRKIWNHYPHALYLGYLATVSIHIHYSYNFLHTHFGGSIFLFLVLGWPISDKSLSGVDWHLEAFPHLLHHATDSYEYRHAERIGIPHQSDHAHCKMHAIHGHSWPISLWISLDLFKAGGCTSSWSVQGPDYPELWYLKSSEHPHSAGWSSFLLLNGQKLSHISIGIQWTTVRNDEMMKQIRDD